MNPEGNPGPDSLQPQENAGSLALALLGGREEGDRGPSPAQLELRRRVLAAVRSPSTQRSYTAALDDLFRFRAGPPLNRTLLAEWKAGMERVSPRPR